MTQPLPVIGDAEINLAAGSVPADRAGLGALMTERGSLPLESLDVHARIDGLLARVVVRQTFCNACGPPLRIRVHLPVACLSNAGSRRGLRNGARIAPCDWNSGTCHTVPQNRTMTSQLSVNCSRRVPLS